MRVESVVLGALSSVDGQINCISDGAKILHAKRKPLSRIPFSSTAMLICCSFGLSERLNCKIRVAKSVVEFAYNSSGMERSKSIVFKKVLLIFINLC